MASLSGNGLEAATLEEILALIESDQIATISAGLDLSASSPLGQINRLLARAIRLQEEALLAVYRSLDPDSATGDALWRLGAITGTIREPATKTRVQATINLDAGTYNAGTLFAHPSGRASDRFTNIAQIVHGGGVTSAVFEAETAGAIEVAADTLVISSAVAGWNSIDSNLAGVTGLEIESEAAFRYRRTQEIEARASASARGIATAISQGLPDVTTVYVVENQTDATVDSIPAHSIEVVVWGPVPSTQEDDQAVAEIIYSSKAAGIGTYGNTNETVVDSAGYGHVINFTRVSARTVTIAMTIEYTDGEYSGDLALSEALVARAAESLRPGRDLSGSMLAAWAHEVPGVLRVTDVTIDGGGSFGTEVCGSREVLSFVLGDVTITSTAEDP